MKTDKIAIEPAKETQDERGQKVGLWATGGAVISAILSSACCWLPFLLIAFGASAAGVSGFFEEGVSRRSPSRRIHSWKTFSVNTLSAFTAAAI